MKQYVNYKGGLCFNRYMGSVFIVLWMPAAALFSLPMLFRTMLFVLLFVCFVVFARSGICFCCVGAGGCSQSFQDSQIGGFAIVWYGYVVVCA